MAATMRLTTVAVAGALVVAVAGCSEILDQAGITGEDREMLERLGEGLEDSFNEEFGEDFDFDEDEPYRDVQDPDWSPDIPAPPGIETEVSQRDERREESGECGSAGRALYGEEHYDEIVEHYEEYYNREADREVDKGSSGEWKQWDDEETDSQVEIQDPIGGLFGVNVCNEPA